MALKKFANADLEKKVLSRRSQRDISDRRRPGIEGPDASRNNFGSMIDTVNTTDDIDNTDFSDGAKILTRIAIAL